MSTSLSTSPYDDTIDSWRYAGRTKPTAATAVALYNSPLTMDLLGAVSMGSPNRDNWLLQDEKLSIEEVHRFQAAGGSSIVDVTSIGLKRDPEALLRVSRVVDPLQGLRFCRWGSRYLPPHRKNFEKIQKSNSLQVLQCCTGFGDRLSPEGERHAYRNESRR
jgi:hypothetical protein